MFKNLFKKDQNTQLYAPLSGKIMALEDVPDPVFNQKMMGEGIAVSPTDSVVVAPFAGKIIQLPNTKHAVGLSDNNGNEVLVHIGLDTVDLNGEGFTAKVQADEQVEKGQPLIELDLDYLQKNAKDIVTPIVVTNSESNGKKFESTHETQAKAGETILMTISES